MIKNYGLKIRFGEKAYLFPFRLDTSLGGYFFFFLGYYAKDTIRKVEKLTIIKKLMFSIWAGLTLLGCAYFNGMVNIVITFNNPILYLVGCIAGIFTVFVFASCCIRYGRTVLIWYGKNSLPVFALHSLFLYGYAAVLSKVLAQRLIVMENISLLYSLAGTAVCLVGVIPFVYVYNRSIAVVIRKINQR